MTCRGFSLTTWSADYEFPRLHQVLRRLCSAVPRRAWATAGVESVHQFAPLAPLQRLELRGVGRLQIKFVLLYHRHDPRWHGRDQRREIAERHRFVMRLPVIVAFGYDALRRRG